MIPASALGRTGRRREQMLSIQCTFFLGDGFCLGLEQDRTAAGAVLSAVHVFLPALARAAGAGGAGEKVHRKRFSQ